jgi:hypothetical protein
LKVSSGRGDVIYTCVNEDCHEVGREQTLPRHLFPFMVPGSMRCLGCGNVMQSKFDACEEKRSV